MNITSILVQLNKERFKYTNSDHIKMRHLIDELVKCGEYPQPTSYMIKTNSSYLDMVENWGVYWHEYDKPHQCINCGFDLRDINNGPPFKLGLVHTCGDSSVGYV